MFASREIHVGNAVIGRLGVLWVQTVVKRKSSVSLECGAQGAVPLPVPGLGGRWGRGGGGGRRGRGKGRREEGKGEGCLGGGVLERGGGVLSPVVSCGVLGSDRSYRRCASSHCAPRVQRAASGEGGFNGSLGTRPLLFLARLSFLSPWQIGCFARSLARHTFALHIQGDASQCCLFFVCGWFFFLLLQVFASRVPLSLNDDYILTEVHSFRRVTLSAEEVHWQRVSFKVSPS